MQQDIPAEASELSVFTPSALKGLDKPPVFHMRAATTREKRFRLRMHRENGIVSHAEDDIRAEIMAGIKAGWTEDDSAILCAHLQSFWDAQDAFRVQSREDPELKWEFDPALEANIGELISKLETSWRPLARMNADIAEYADMQPMFYVAVTVKSWTSIEVKPETDRGYLTMECAEAIFEALNKLDREANEKPGTSWGELYGACIMRWYLSDETVGNSESPAPSTTTPPASTAKKPSAARGSSRVRASSKKIPASA